MTTTVRQGVTPDLTSPKPSIAKWDKLQARPPASWGCTTCTPYLQGISGSHKTGQIKSQKRPDKEFYAINSSPVFSPNAEGKETELGVRTSCLGPSSLCIFKRANRQSSPFFSWATLVNVGRTTAWWKWEAEAQFLHFPSVKYSNTILLQIPAELYGRQRNLGPQKARREWVRLEVYEALDGFAHSPE